MGIPRPLIVALLVAVGALAGATYGEPSVNVRAAAPSPSGVALPVGDLPGWHQTFADDFTRAQPFGSIDDHGPPGWSYAYDYPDTQGRDTGGSRWSPAVIGIHDGVMDYWLHTANGTALSGAVGREPGQVYGRFVVRMRADPVVGYKTAFLLWPDSETWPRDGEIDFPEGDLAQTVGGATHYQGGTSGGDQDVWDTATTYGDWHTYAIDWTPGYVAYSIDGREVHRTTQRLPNTPMHWVLQSEAWIGAGQAPASSDGHVLIDWAAVYAYVPGAAGSTPPITPTRPPTPMVTSPTPMVGTATPLVTPTQAPPAAPSAPVAPTPTPTPTVQPGAPPHVTLPCTSYTARPDGQGGTTFACAP